MDEKAVVFDTEWTDEPKCPYCGFEGQDWWDGLEPKSDGDSWDVDCGDCGKEYRVIMSVSTHFSTEKIEKVGPAQLSIFDNQN